MAVSLYCNALYYRGQPHANHETPRTIDTMVIIVVRALDMEFISIKPEGEAGLSHARSLWRGGQVCVCAGRGSYHSKAITTHAPLWAKSDLGLRGGKLDCFQPGIHVMQQARHSFDCQFHLAGFADALLYGHHRQRCKDSQSNEARCDLCA
jgi:hypothetical protein